MRPEDSNRNEGDSLHGSAHHILRSEAVSHLRLSVSHRCHVQRRVLICHDWIAIDVDGGSQLDGHLLRDYMDHRSRKIAYPAYS